jgi:hypothetical protein
MRAVQASLWVGFLVGAVYATHVEPAPISAIAPAKVYITNSGTKYHRAGCRYLKKSALDIELDAAKKAGYTPCKVCKP